jgi:hypothetical protein
LFARIFPVNKKNPLKERTNLVSCFHFSTDFAHCQVKKYLLMATLHSEAQIVVASNSQTDSILTINGKKAVATKNLILA